MFYKIDVLEPCFNKVAGLQKETLLQMFSSKFCKIFKKICFIEHPELLLLHFEEVIIKIDVKKFYITKISF